MSKFNNKIIYILHSLAIINFIYDTTFMPSIREYNTFKIVDVENIFGNLFFTYLKYEYKV